MPPPYGLGPLHACGIGVRDSAGCLDGAGQVAEGLLDRDDPAGGLAVDAGSAHAIGGVLDLLARRTTGLGDRAVGVDPAAGRQAAVGRGPLVLAPAAHRALLF